MVVGYLSIDTIAIGSARHDSVPGGGALYGALGARAAGAEVALFAAAGEDLAPEWIDRLHAIGIDCSRLEHRAGPTRRARLAHAADGARTSPHHAEALWAERTAALAPPLPDGGAAALMLAPMPVDHLARCLDRASAPVVADTSEAFAAAGLEPFRVLLPGLALFAPSREETRLLCPGRDDDDAARELAASGAGIVQKRGAEGVVLCEPGGSRLTRIVADSVTVLDPTGAGDAMVGALAAGLAARLSLADNARQAAAIGARAVTGLGPAALGLAP